MARPPVEWPIPAYVVELRERLIAAYRAPARLLAPLVPAPVTPDLVRGQAVVALALGKGRCLKTVGGIPTLAGEFHVAEVFTPVYWQGACRPALRGSFLLRIGTDADGLNRLIRTALRFPAGRLPLPQDSAPEGCAAGSPGYRLVLPRSTIEEPWPEGSLYSSHEAAEAHLLHPEACFVPLPDRVAVHAVPIHQYARSTTHLRPLHASAALLAETLSAREEELVLDHVFLQKRCTHTWSFPPERIAAARPSPVPRQQAWAAAATR